MLEALPEDWHGGPLISDDEQVQGTRLRGKYVILTPDASQPYGISLYYVASEFQITSSFETPVLQLRLCTPVYWSDIYTPMPQDALPPIVCNLRGRHLESVVRTSAIPKSLFDAMVAASAVETTELPSGLSTTRSKVQVEIHMTEEFHDESWIPLTKVHARDP